MGAMTVGELRMYQIPAWWTAIGHLQLHRDLSKSGCKQDAEQHLLAWQTQLPRCELVVGETSLTHREVANA